jgi:hypothetical protein
VRQFFDDLRAAIRCGYYDFLRRRWIARRRREMQTPF